MLRLNRKNVAAKSYTEKVIQFGEGNFLRGFADWIIWNMDRRIGFDASVVVVQPIAKGMAGVLNEQDGLYDLNLQGLDGGKPVNSIEMIDVVSRAINPYEDFDAYLKLAEDPNMRFIISNTTEAGIAFDPECKPATGRLFPILAS
jgi:tagaturonate reductase